MLKLLISLLIFQLFAVAKPLSVNVSYEDKQTYPYVMGFSNKTPSENPGVTIEVLQAIEKELNVQFVFKREQGVRGQKQLQANQSDMLLFASYKPAREELGVYPKTKDGEIDTSRKAMDLSYVLYTLKDSKLSWDGKKFINLTGKIGVTKGYSITSFLEERGVEISENTSNLGDPKKLIAKRIQGFANQDSKIDPYLKENPNLASKIKKISPPLKTKPYYIMFSHRFYKGHQALADTIWDLTADHFNNPKYSEIVKKY